MRVEQLAQGMEPVAEAFAAITADGEPAALVVRGGDEVLLDLSAGTDGAGRAFTSTTPVLLYSAVKPAAALAVLLAARDGHIGLDAPLARSWPAFGAHGKDRVTVRMALAHGAAVPGWREPVSVAGLADDRVSAADALADAEPWWTPGEPGEHAVSYGHLLDGLLRHATGQDIVDWWNEVEAITGIALQPGAGGRAPATLEDTGGAWRREWSAAPGLMGDLLRNPIDLLDVEVMNAPVGRSLVAPAVTGYGAAHDLARMWAWWTGAGARSRLGGLAAESLAPHTAGRDHVLEREVAWGLGPQLDEEGPGMGGVGGCVGWHQDGLSIGLTTPRVGPLARFDPLDDALARLR
jgi:CubicO group peptidase (beta-lactamase class C family)